MPEHQTPESPAYDLGSSGAFGAQVPRTPWDWASPVSGGTVAAAKYFDTPPTIRIVDFGNALDCYFQPAIDQGLWQSGGCPGTATSAAVSDSGLGGTVLYGFEPSHATPKDSIAPLAFHTTRTLPVIDFKPGERTGVGALRNLLAIAPLPAERLAPVLGVSRRSIYNWSRGRPPSPAHEATIQRLRDVLEPLAAGWHPERIAQWFEQSADEPAKLAATGHWDALAALVRSATLARPTQEALEARSDIEPDEYAPTVRAAALAAFARVRTLPARRPGWQPKELTGIGEPADQES